MPCKVIQRPRAYSQIKRLPSMCRKVSLRENPEDIKGVDVIMYPFQLLGWSSSPVGLHVAIGMGEVISGSLDFD